MQFRPLGAHRKLHLRTLQDVTDARLQKSPVLRAQSRPAKCPGTTIRALVLEKGHAIHSGQMLCHSLLVYNTRKWLSTRTINAFGTSE